MFYSFLLPLFYLLIVLTLFNIIYLYLIFIIKLYTSPYLTCVGSSMHFLILLSLCLYKLFERTICPMIVCVNIVFCIPPVLSSLAPPPLLVAILYSCFISGSGLKNVDYKLFGVRLLDSRLSKNRMRSSQYLLHFLYFGKN